MTPELKLLTIGIFLGVLLGALCLLLIRDILISHFVENTVITTKIVGPKDLPDFQPYLEILQVADETVTSLLNNHEEFHLDDNSIAQLSQTKMQIIAIVEDLKTKGILKEEK